MSEFVDSTKTHVFTPYGAALDLFNNRDPEVLLSGPAGTGKSRACLEKVHACALLNPGMRGLLVRKTQKSLTSTALTTWRRDVISEAERCGLVSYYGGSAQEPAQYRYSNGSVILMVGMDNATKIMSSEFDIIYVQEAIEIKEDDWQALTTRLRSGQMSFQQLIADTNPDSNTHWLKQRCDNNQTTLLESRHEDNPVYFDRDGQLTEKGVKYIGVLDSLTGVMHKRMRLGLWVAAEGIIYDMWDPHKHVVPRFDIPNDWDRFLSIDFGHSHPFVCQWWAEDPDGGLWLYREIYKTKTLVEDHAEEIDRLSKGEPYFKAVITDHDAEDRATLERHLKYSTTAAHKNVNDGIAAVAERLRTGRLHILEDSVVQRDRNQMDAKLPCSTIEEFAGYIWDDQKERPVKENDDGCDALRYAVAAKDLVGKFNIRFLG